jgi:hypothetical protein
LQFFSISDSARKWQFFCFKSNSQFVGVLKFQIELAGFTAARGAASSFHGYAPITIAEPKPDSVEVSLELGSSFIQPGASAIPLTAIAKTMTGVGIVGADLKLSWTVMRRPFHHDIVMPFYYTQPAFPAPADLETGQLSLTVTERSGAIESSIDVSSLLKPLEVGDRLSVNVEWTGPAKELVTDSKTVEVEFAPVRLTLRKQGQSTRTLPGFEFDVMCEMQDLEFGSATASYAQTPIKIYLVEDSKFSLNHSDTWSPQRSETGAYEMVGSAEPVCTVSTGGSCRMMLPKMGRYLVIAQADIPDAGVAATYMAAGMTEEQWRAQPLSSIEDLSFKLDKREYSPEDKTAVLQFENPFGQARLTVMLFTSEGAIVSTDQKDVTVAGPTEHRIEMGQQCLEGCTVSALLLVPRQSMSIRMPVPVPTSLLFDATAPQSFSSSMSISIRRSTLATVRASAVQPLVKPGSSVAFDISVDVDGAPTEAELCVVAVAKSFLVLGQNYQLKNLTTDFTPYMEGSSAQVFLPSHQMPDNATLAVNRTIARRVARDPWVVPQWDVDARYSSVDRSDDEFFSQYMTQLTADEGASLYPIMAMDMAYGGIAMEAMESNMAMAMPVMAMPVMAAPAPAPPMMGAKMSAADMGGPVFNPVVSSVARDMSQTGGGASPRVRSNFEPTAMFLGKKMVGKSGSTRVEFKLPDGVDTYVLYAYAATADGKFGQAESSVVARTALNLQPVVPQIVRHGDEFEAGVTVMTTADTGETHSLQVEASSSEGSLKLGSAASMTLSNVRPQEPREALFHFKAEELGKSDLTFSANGAKIDGDALMKPLPVLGIQDSVFVATSMGITASPDGKKWDEAVDLPDALRGSGTINVSAAAGHLPAVLAFAEEALDWPKRPSAYHYLNTMVANVALSRYNVRSSLMSRVTAKAKEAVDMLESLTLEETGLKTYPPRDNWSRQYVNAQLQAFGIFVAGRAQAAGVLKAETPKLRSITATWVRALGMHIEEQLALAAEANPPREWFDGELLAAVYSALASQASESASLASTRPPSLCNIGVCNADSISFDKLVAGADKLSARSAASVALLLPNTDPTVARVRANLVAQLRVVGRTVALRDSGFDASAPAMLLWLLAQAPPDVENPCVDAIII